MTAMLITSRPTPSDREIMEAAIKGIPVSYTLAAQIDYVANVVEIMGHGDRLTTRQIRRFLIAKGRA